MHYLFFDEKFFETDEDRGIVVSAWAVEQGVLNNRQRVLIDLLRPGKAPLLVRINCAFELLNAFAFVARAQLSKSLFRGGEVDSCGDISAMARPDTIWSTAMVFVVGHLLRHLSFRGHALGTVDLYFDPKSLRVDHRAAWQETLRGLLTKEARRFGSQLGLETLKQLRIRRIEFVEKSKGGSTPNKFQLGTWLSDRLCSKSAEILEGGRLSRIKAREMSDVITRTVRQWDGVSFYV